MTKNIYLYILNKKKCKFSSIVIYRHFVSQANTETVLISHNWRSTNL